MPNEKKDQQPLINGQWSWFFCALSRRRPYGYVCHICYSLLLHSVQRSLSFNFDYSLLAVLCVTTCQPIGFRLYFRFLMVIGFLLYFFLSSTLCVLILSDTLAAIFLNASHYPNAYRILWSYVVSTAIIPLIQLPQCSFSEIVST